MTQADRFTVVAVLLLSGCGGSGGPGSGGESTPIVALGDGVDVPNGADPGDGVERAGGRDFRACHQDKDCLGGICLVTGTTSAGVCAMVCFAAPSLPLERSFTLQPCDRGHACAVSGGIGLCVSPCTTNADCPLVSGVKFTCGAIGGAAGSWCQ
jgi:hypothetical protein